MKEEMKTARKYSTIARDYTLFRVLDKAGYKLSPPSISALLTSEPKQVKTQTMDALCTALECTPNELWKHTPTLVKKIERPTTNKLAMPVNESISEDKLPPI